MTSTERSGESTSSELQVRGVQYGVEQTNHGTVRNPPECNGTMSRLRDVLHNGLAVLFWWRFEFAILPRRRQHPMGCNAAVRGRFHDVRCRSGVLKR
jgi:hypothetical protein